MSSQNVEINSLLREIQNIHFPASIVHQNINRIQAELSPKEDDLEKIFHLTESHTPGLRTRAILQYDKAFVKENYCVPVNKDNVQFLCAPTEEQGIQQMLKQVAEMPIEWLLVQLTPSFSKTQPEPFHISVFECGQQSRKPICVTLKPPTCKVTGDTIDLCKQMNGIIIENKDFLSNLLKTKGKYFKNHQDKLAYQINRDNLNVRLKEVVKQLQDNWLGVWRCLFIGKYVNGKIEAKIKQICKELTEDKNRFHMQFLIKSAPYLTPHELLQGVRYCFPDKSPEFHSQLAKTLKTTSDELGLYELKRHPIILIIDERLDCFPWEMLDVLTNHPASRMPSLHFTYALFKEHEYSIVNGVKTGVCARNGAYILNPDLDLKMMEWRLKMFFEYWTPDWRGLVGVKPTSEQFEEMLTNCDIFSYNGHGSGEQFLAGDKIQKLRVNAVVLLSGCSSVKLTNLGPQVEMLGPHYKYLIACSPCVMGMLWTVTDLDTDKIATEIFSQWIPSKARVDWKYINKSKWEMGIGGTVEPAKKASSSKPEEKETEFLRVLCKAKKSAQHYTTQAACVARGLPVKIT